MRGDSVRRGDRGVDVIAAPPLKIDAMPLAAFCLSTEAARINDAAV